MDKPQLNFYLVNSNRLESGRAAAAQFSSQGGTIGSNADCTWSLQDSLGKVAGIQCRIVWQDQTFCLKTLTEPVRLNQTAIPRHAGAVRLSRGDIIEIGELQFKTYLAMTDEPYRDPMAVAPQDIVSAGSNPLDNLMDTRAAQDDAPLQGDDTAPSVRGSRTRDPLQALENESLTTGGSQTENDVPGLLADRRPASSAAMPLSDNRGNTIVQEYMDLPKLSATDRTDELLPVTDADHIAVNPLMHGLEAHLPMHNSRQANDFLTEVGRTLKAAIEGLLALQKTQDNLRDKQLRPIEDNPLRLNVDYQEALHLLFGDERSPVHLSPTAAVSESLTNMQLHYQANLEAISVALDTMLDAFSPERLLARFSQYQRAGEECSSDPAWAWQMYVSYYRELKSCRQQGFEKLFYEVYTHAYDQALRKGL
ncbi:type VI secretion system-associated FHA domain protein TagH [Morganella morganii]|uniref:type VI secretion system-associated FHA domain protein TagH n=1 Tax=Morganella morganii TaxID=582 RepID=UPI0032D9FC40